MPNGQMQLLVFLYINMTKSRSFNKYYIFIVFSKIFERNGITKKTAIEQRKLNNTIKIFVVASM